jgi:carboxyl-terminal processing protease
VYGPLRETDACILDLRDGFGGRPEGFADPFFRPEAKLEWKSPQLSYTELFGYQKPLVVLINGGSRSAKEVLSHILKTSKRATLIGSTTAGNVLGTFPLPISDWAYLEIPMVDVITDGIRLEGKGVAPDIAVDQEFTAEGKDLYLQRAVEFLTQK